MPTGSYKIQLCGLRTYPAIVGFFAAPPVDAVEQRMSSGIFDICLKKHYPPPGTTLPTLLDFDLVAEIPFSPVRGHTTYTRAALDHSMYATPALAWLALQSMSLEVFPDPGTVLPYCELEAYGLNYGPNQWDAQFVYGGQNIAVSESLISPSWLTDDDILFFADVTPTVSPLGSGFVQLRIGQQNLACDGILKSVFLPREYLVANHFILAPESRPAMCSLGQALSLDTVPLPNHYGGNSRVNVSGNIVLRVIRRLGCPYVIITPDIISKYQYGGLMTAPDGFFIGPAFPLSGGV